MKTHQEIRDAIQSQLDEGTTSFRVLDILHALNDRIEALQTYCRERECDTKIITANIGSDLARVEKRLEEIHPTIT